MTPVRLRQIIFALVGAAFLFPAAVFADDCVQTALASRSSARPSESTIAAIEQATGAPRSTWLCRDLVAGENRAAHCVHEGACGGLRHCCIPAPAGSAGGGSCVSNANRTQAETVAGQLGASVSRTDFSGWSRRKICNDSARNRCIPSPDTSDGTDVLCCAPNTPGANPGGSCANPTSGASQPARPVTSGAFALPGCIDNGDCTLDDIIRTGTAFANFLFGISGAIFLLIFVYAGFLYLVAGESGEVAKSKKMLTEATIGMVLMFGAGTLVRFVYGTISTPSTTGETPQVSPCEQRHGSEGYACVHVPGASQRARTTSRPDCLPNLCTLPGQATMLCCPLVSQGNLPEQNAQEGTAPSP